MTLYQSVRSQAAQIETLTGVRNLMAEKEQQLVVQVRALTAARDRLSAQCEELPLANHCIELAKTRELREKVSRLSAELAKKGTTFGRPIRWRD